MSTASVEPGQDQRSDSPTMGAHLIAPPQADPAESALLTVSVIAGDVNFIGRSVWSPIARVDRPYDPQCQFIAARVGVSRNRKRVNKVYARPGVCLSVLPRRAGGEEGGATEKSRGRDTNRGPQLGAIFDKLNVSHMEKLTGAEAPAHRLSLPTSKRPIPTMMASSPRTNFWRHSNPFNRERVSSI
jgi:hypothetical protein